MPMAAAKRSLAALTVALTASATRTQDPAIPLVTKLQTDGTRAAAHARLVRLGSAAVPALVSRLGTADQSLYRECLHVLRDLGPAAGDAFPSLVLDRDNMTAERVSTLAELVPFRPNDCSVDRQILLPFFARAIRAWTTEDSIAVQRWDVRSKFARELAVPDLVRIAGGIRPLRAEVAIDLIGARGSAATEALPVLREVLGRPEPRIIGAEECLPLHRKAARAVLAITSDGELAMHARRVIDGIATPAALDSRAPPMRLRQRLTELTAALARQDTRTHAIDNLVALGQAAAVPVGRILETEDASETVLAAAAVLRRLGSRGVAGVPGLVGAIRRMPVECTLSLLEALTATAPWSRDVVPDLTYSEGGGTITVMGSRLAGTADLDFCNAFQVASETYAVAMRLDPDMPVAELEIVLNDPWLAARERALAIAAERGVECRALLPQLDALLTASQPAVYKTERAGGGIISYPVDRTPHVQRSAAQAIVAIAPPGHPSLPAARAVLATPKLK